MPLTRRSTPASASYAEAAQRLWPSSWWVDGDPPASLPAAYAVVWRADRGRLRRHHVVRLYGTLKAAGRAVGVPRRNGGRIYRLTLDGRCVRLGRHV